MASAALLVIGSEMLDPDRRDANGPHARQRLAELGVPLALVTRVEDREETIAAALRAALASADVVITCGGLGPTGDDLTREAVAGTLGCGVHEDAGWAAELERRLAARGRALDVLGRRQACVVDGADVIPNPRGLACGSLLRAGEALIALLPGPPSEFRAMFDEQLAPVLARRFPDPPDVRVVRAIAAGLPEAQAEPVLAPWYRKPGVAVSILPVMGVLRITFTLTGLGTAAEQEARDALRVGLGTHLVSLDGVALEDALGRRLLARGWTLAGAESCTGGAAARKVVSVPGASRYFRGAIEAYADDVKTGVLGIPAEILREHGAVSGETALALADAARRLFTADCAYATTGIAGPGGGTAAKPVGLVWLAALTPQGQEIRRIDFPLDRVSTMELAANYALFGLFRLLG